MLKKVNMIKNLRKLNLTQMIALNKPLKLHLLTIIVRRILEEDVKFYPQLYLDDCLYEV